jgi:hypothetical protein
MSINNSYFSRNNTILSNVYVNTGRSPITQLYFGSTTSQNPLIAYSRFIFDLDLNLLQEKYANGTITSGCSSTATHTLMMRNTGSFDKSLLNTLVPSENRQRATSFDLVLFRIPPTTIIDGEPQFWDEGVGYDYIDILSNQEDKNFSERPSNWYQTTTLSGWSTNGIYDNTNSQLGNVIHYSALTIIDEQHFEFGDEDISFDMSNEINSILNGSLTGVTGWGVAFKPELERITGLTQAYTVGFFTRHTQTFYEPYLLTDYNDLISDDRDSFSLNKVNKLYLYVYEDGTPINLDTNPTVSITNNNGDVISSLSALTTCRRTKGVYEVTVPALLGYKTPCTFTDTWKGLYLNGVQIPNIENEFVLKPYSSSISIGTSTNEPSSYGFDYYGIKQDEKILNTDIRKVGVIIKKEYTSNQLLNKIKAYYRVYVKEGQTEVQVQDWTQVNKTPNEYYFIFDTRDKIPNEYFVDLKLNINSEVTTYKKQIKFQIVNKK